MSSLYCAMYKALWVKQETTSALLILIVCREAIYSLIHKKCKYETMTKVSKVKNLVLEESLKDIPALFSSIINSAECSEI